MCAAESAALSIGGASVALDFLPRGAAHGFLLRGVPAAASARQLSRFLSRWGGLERVAPLDGRPGDGEGAQASRAFLVTYLRPAAAAAARRWLHGRRLGPGARAPALRAAPLRAPGAAERGAGAPALGGGSGAAAPMPAAAAPARARAGVMTAAACAKMLAEAAPLRWSSTVVAVETAAGGAAAAAAAALAAPAPAVPRAHAHLLSRPMLAALAPADFAGAAATAGGCGGLGAAAAAAAAAAGVDADDAMVLSPTEAVGLVGSARLDAAGDFGGLPFGGSTLSGAGERWLVDAVGRRRSFAAPFRGARWGGALGIAEGGRMSAALPRVAVVPVRTRRALVPLSEAMSTSAAAAPVLPAAAAGARLTVVLSLPTECGGVEHVEGHGGVGGAARGADGGGDWAPGMAPFRLPGAGAPFVSGRFRGLMPGAPVPAPGAYTAPPPADDGGGLQPPPPMEPPPPPAVAFLPLTRACLRPLALPAHLDLAEHQLDIEASYAHAGGAASAAKVKALRAHVAQLRAQLDRAPLDAAWRARTFSTADVAAGAPLRRAADMALRDACRQLVFAQPLDGDAADED